MFDPKIAIRCPKCGRETKKPLAGLQSQDIRCPCGTTLRVDASGAKQAGAAIGKLNQALAKLRRKR